MTNQGVQEGAFKVSLGVFDGPFDLLLTLITKHELDITEISLSLVTDEFISYLTKLEADGNFDLDQASEFLVVAATLLDLKIASLLPQGEVVDEEGIALLEARDLLFAKLLQYRAFKLSSEWFAKTLVAESKRHPRQVAIDEKFRKRAPELKWDLTKEDFAALAVMALMPKTLPTLSLDHLHAPLVSIREQAALMIALLKNEATKTFRELIMGVAEKGVIVARFLALLELFRRDTVSFEQLEPLGELSVRWLGTDLSDDDLSTLGADYD